MTDERIAPVEESMLFFADKVCESDLDWVVDRGGDGVTAYSSEIPFSLFNFIAGLDVGREGAISLGKEMCDSFIERGVPWLWWTTPSHASPALDNLFTSYSLRSGVAPGMYRSLDDLPDLDEGIARGSCIRR